MLEAYALYSGSAGNAYIIRSGTTTLLLDCGRSAAALCRAVESVGARAEDISAVLLTHEHTDHVSALRVFHKKHRVPIIAAASVLSCVCDTEEMCSLARVPAVGGFAIGGIYVRCCSVPHDASANLSYSFTASMGETLAVATDVGQVTEGLREHLRGASVAVIESNHDKNMLRTGPYPQRLKSRIASKFGHLSNDEAAALALDMARDGCRGFVLAHLSPENNTPTLAADTVRGRLREGGFPDLPLLCAGESHPVRMLLDGESCILEEICDI